MVINSGTIILSRRHRRRCCHHTCTTFDFISISWGADWSTRGNVKWIVTEKKLQVSTPAVLKPALAGSQLFDRWILMECWIFYFEHIFFVSIKCGSIAKAGLKATICRVCLHGRAYAGMAKIKKLTCFRRCVAFSGQQRHNTITCEESDFTMTVIEFFFSWTGASAHVNV